MLRMKLLLRALGIFGRLVILMSFWMVIGIQVWMVGTAGENDDEDRWLVFSGHLCKI
ncbi:hypothetical protein HanHA300_Chr08g0286251 [Helianthus annuus]|nr:hypothetical protein HanHA300_Chr08g0286251 [Helianthus annuus]